MFERFKRFFSRRNSVTDAEFYQQIDALNADAGGGQPIPVTELLAWLPLRSNAITVADPQNHLPGVVVSGVSADKLEIVATSLKYPTGQATIAALTLRLGDPAHRRRIGNRFGETDRRGQGRHRRTLDSRRE
jgi:hypothetical protein